MSRSARLAPILRHFTALFVISVINYRFVSFSGKQYNGYVDLSIYQTVGRNVSAKFFQPHVLRHGISKGKIYRVLYRYCTYSVPSAVQWRILGVARRA